MTGAGSQTRESIVEEAIRIVEEANRRGLALRLIGGLAIHLRGGDGLPEARAYPDIDLVTLKGLRKPVSDLLVDLGYRANERFNTISEARSRSRSCC